MNRALWKIFLHTESDQKPLQAPNFRLFCLFWSKRQCTCHNFLGRVATQETGLPAGRYSLVQADMFLRTPTLTVLLLLFLNFNTVTGRSATFSVPLDDHKFFWLTLIRHREYILFWFAKLYPRQQVAWVYIVSCPDPTCKERVWWHSADSLGFI